MKLLTVLLLSLTLTGATPWSINFDEAKKEATASKKHIILNFSGSDWCGPCIKLKQDFFESEDFQKYATDNLVLLRADFPRLKKNKLSKQQTEHNEMLAEKYNPQGKFPLTVLLDANGKIIKEWDGYLKNKTPLDFVHDIHVLVKK
jgi:thioredoxin-related protein